MLSVRYENDDQVEVGIDEAGRGCFYGTMYAAAVIWPLEEAWSDDLRALTQQLRDSKKLSPKKRDRLADQIMEAATAFGIGRVTAAEIDDNGMTWANQMAFVRALEGLKRRDGSAVEADRILIDGILGLPHNAGKASQEVITIIEGDAQYIPIAAASILAKVFHDRELMVEIDMDPVLEEKYNLRSCKGYGTAKHRAGIEAHGIHPNHRRRFLVKLLGSMR
jgi:ribonuclease HII